MSDSAEIFQKVRDAVDIVEVVGEHVALKRAGREFKGLCPFHDDHRPSMAVVPHKQIFHCFVCGTGGDVFKFVKEFHKMGNGEALRMLAQRAGIKLPELPKKYGHGGGGQSEGPSQREQIAQTNEWACTFFEKTLRSPEGKAGLDYFHSRGLTDETIAKFRLGMSPDSWTGLCNAALRLSIKNDHLDMAGLVKKRSDGSPYDVFRNRVIFPIIDSSGGGGRVIAFGGRVLVEKRDEAGNVVEAKYLNSPETRLFNKSESIYGLNHARQQIIRTRTAVVVEGYMDVIAAHQAGVANVIATLGTALTPEHARLLKNYAQTIVLVFDSDDAGFRAADRAMEVFVKTPLDIKIASVPDGKDPCDFCMKNGGELFQKLVDHAVDALTYQWNRLQRQFHATTSLSARQEAITQFLRFVATAMYAPGPGGGGANGANMDPVRRGLLFSKIAGLVGLSVNELPALLAKLARQSAPLQRVAPAPQQQEPPPQIEPVYEEPQDSGPKTQNSAPDLRNLKGLDAAESWLLGALLVRPALYEKFRDDISLHLFVTFQPLASALLEYFENHPDLAACSLADLTSTFEELGRSAAIIRYAIELEQRTSDWLESANLSPQHVKMLQHAHDDRGLNAESLLADSLKELQSKRGGTDPSAAADLDGPTSTGNPSQDDPLAAAMKAIQQAKSRNAAGGDRRVTG